jgi:hypothetical protein
VDPIIYAPDIDEPGTNNSLVGYRVLNMSITNREIEFPILFTTYLIENPDGNRARLKTLVDLKHFWGTYNIHIRVMYLHTLIQSFIASIHKPHITFLGVLSLV